MPIENLEDSQYDFEKVEICGESEGSGGEVQKIVKFVQVSEWYPLGQAIICKYVVPEGFEPFYGDRILLTPVDIPKGQNGRKDDKYSEFAKVGELLLGNKVDDKVVRSEKEVEVIFNGNLNLYFIKR